MDQAAARLGLAAGMALAEARAMCPEIDAIEAAPQQDRRDFRALAERLISYSPLVYIHALGEAFIDIAGCERLFGGEEAIFESLRTRFAAAGLEAAIAVADTAGAAWAIARHGGGGMIAPGDIRRALAPLPVEALRLEPSLADALRRLGLKRVGQLYDMPRAPLTARFSAALLMRLGQALGTHDEPMSPLHPAPQFFADLKLGEPVSTLEATRDCLALLAEKLAADLDAARRGGRRFELTLFRVDNSLMTLKVRTGAPAASAAHIRRLFDNRLDDFQRDYDPGFGVDHLRLSAFDAARTARVQHAFFERGESDEALAELKDRLSNRLGAENVCAVRFENTHLPERAAPFTPAIGMAAGATPPADEPAPVAAPRPIRLLARPEAIEALAQVPDGPPARFTWRRVTYMVTRASGPERISGEWWRQDGEAPTRDYYRVEDEAGRRYWIYREGLYGRETAAPQWRLHGFFA